MADSGRTSCLAVPERAKIHAALTLFQVGHAGNHVLLRAALDMGVSKLVFPLYRNIIALFVLVPWAYFLEKKDRPPLTFAFLIQFFLHGLIGITLNQGLYLVGLENTSPTFATAMDNAIPAITFLMATIFRLERVDLKRQHGKAKVIGTVASVVGASIMTLYKGPPIYEPTTSQPHLAGEARNDTNWTFGCVCLVLRCFCWSSWFIMQAPLLKKYPARLSVASYTCFFSVLQFFAIAASVERGSQAWQVGSGGELFIIFYSGLIASGMAFAIQIWVIDRTGPVFMSLYLPLQILLVAILSSIFLKEEFYVGGIIGAVLIIAGLYTVLWGKNEESRVGREETEEENTIGKSSLVKPLLS